MKFSIKKILIFLFILILTIIVYKTFLSPKDSFRSVNMIPENAFLLVESDDPFTTWKELNESNIWKHMQVSSFFKDLNSDINSIDSLLNEHKIIFRLFGSRKVMISVHQMKTDSYSSLIVVDMKNLSKLKILKNYLTSLKTDSYNVTKRSYSGYEIYELYDIELKEMMYLSFVHNLVVLSYDHRLLESSLKQSELPVLARNLEFIEVYNQIQKSGQIRFFLNMKKVNKLLDYNNESFDILNQICYTGVKLNIQNDILELDGYLNTIDTIPSILNSLDGTGKGGDELPAHIPKRTFFMVQLSISNFQKMISNLEESLKEEGEFENYMKRRKKIEKFIDISINDNIISWIGDEIGILNIKSKYKNQPSEYVVVLKSNSKRRSKQNLDIINEQIRKNTPAKFNKFEYKGTEINYLSATGLFKVFFGKYFSKLDKPFYMQLDDYVYFSNHPQILKDIIDDIEDNNTLDSWDEFKSFERTNLNPYYNINIFINTPIAINEYKNESLKEYKNVINTNKYFFDQLPFMGIQLHQKDELFYTHLSVLYRDTLINMVINDLILKPKLQNVYDQPDIIEMSVTPKKDIDTVINDSLNDPFNIPRIAIHDLLSRKYEEYYSDRKPKFIIEVANGIKKGEFVWYYPNGNVRLKGKFINDKKEGTWKYYDEYGELIEKRKYD